MIRLTLFYFKNLFFWFRYKNKLKKDSYILIEYTNNSFMNFAIVLLAKIVSISISKKMAVFIMSPVSKPDKNLSLIYRSLGVDKIFYLYDYIDSHGRNILTEFRNCKEVIQNIDDLYRFTYNDVFIGDLLYDTVLRSGKHKATINKIDDDLDDPLYAAIASICFIEEILINHKIEYSVFSHPTTHGGIIQRYLFLKHNIHGVIGFISSSIRKMNSLHEQRNPFPSYVQSKLVDQIFIDNNLFTKYLLLADEFILSKVSGKVKQFDSVSAYSENSIIYKNKGEFNSIRNLDIDKPNVFLSLHVFNDQPNTTNSPFKDYYDWLIESFNVLVNNSNINLIIKEHPSTKFYPTVDFNFDEFKNDALALYKNVYFISSDDKFNTTSIKYLADFIITSGGTIALEATCWGIPSLICSSSYFSDNDIVKRAKTKEEYFYLLENIYLLEIPTSETINRAKIVYYISNGVLWDGTWNNSVFFPNMSFEEKSNPDMFTIMKFYMKFLSTKESVIYVNQMVKFIRNEKSNIFYRDPELSKLEEN